ncbi:MAG: type II secretion system protein [Verrucomicrobia bacterium]|nr:type II secretion system protein [Verrucomicrobiota bacterium]MBS0637033.1 type II secretion system protein [Verrucomicrobiota bacterium]
MKKNDKRKKRAVTLIEMIVVMLLIATIAGALAYNYNASLAEGKAFKTKEGISRIKTILALALAEDTELNPSSLDSTWQQYVKNSPLAGKSDDLLKDGWGKPYEVHFEEVNGEQVITVRSQNLENFNKQKQVK